MGRRRRRYGGGGDGGCPAAGTEDRWRWRGGQGCVWRVRVIFAAWVWCYAGALVAWFCRKDAVFLLFVSIKV